MTYTYTMFHLFRCSKRLKNGNRNGKTQNDLDDVPHFYVQRMKNGKGSSTGTGTIKIYF